MLACFHSDWILPQQSDFLKIIKRIGDINSLHSLSILLGIFSGPAALCDFRFLKLFSYASFCYVYVLASVGEGSALYQELDGYPFRRNHQCV